MRYLQRFARGQDSLLVYRDQRGFNAQGIMLFLGSRSGVGGQLCGYRLPIAQGGNRTVVDTTVVWVDTGEIDLANEVDDRRLGRVFGAADNSEFVDAVLVVAL